MRVRFKFPMPIRDVHDELLAAGGLYAHLYEIQYNHKDENNAGDVS